MGEVLKGFQASSGLSLLYGMQVLGIETFFRKSVLAV